MTKFFKKGGYSGLALAAIYSVQSDGKSVDAVEMSFGASPRMIELPTGSVIHSVVEISEKEFNYLVDNWIGLAQSLEIGGFVAKTEYRVIYNELEIIGYSDKSQEELLDFLELSRGRNFIVKDEDGLPIASIGSHLSQVATYTTWEL